MNMNLAPGQSPVQTYVGDEHGNPNTPIYGKTDPGRGPMPSMPMPIYRDASPRGQGRYSQVPDQMFRQMLPTMPSARRRQPAFGDDEGIPAFADGGIVTQPTVAMIGEAGPEMVVPLTPRRRSYSYSGGPMLPGVSQQPAMPQHPDAPDAQTQIRYQNMGLSPRGPSPQSDYAVGQRAQQQQYAQDANSRANVMAAGVAQGYANANLPRGTSTGGKFDPFGAAKAYTLLEPKLGHDEAHRIAFGAAPATQPSAGAGMLPGMTPNSYSDPNLANAATMPPSPMPQANTTYSGARRAPATQPTTRTAAQGGNPIQFTEQSAREMLRNMSVNNPTMTLGDLKPMWQQTLGEHGISSDASHALWNAWHQEGSLGKFDYPTGPMVQATQPRVDVSPNPQTGAGGLATLPNGQQIVVNAQGRRVGDAIAQGAPLPMVPSGVGPQPGYSPISNMLPNVAGAKPSAQLANAGFSNPTQPFTPGSIVQSQVHPNTGAVSTTVAGQPTSSAGYAPPAGRGMGDFRAADAGSTSAPAAAPRLMPGTAAARAMPQSYPSTGNGQARFPQQAQATSGPQQRTPTTGPARMQLNGRTFVVKGYRNGEPVYAAE